MAESSGDGAAPLMLSLEKRKLEGEPGEGEDLLKGLVKPLTSAHPDLDISTSGSKSTQASNPANKKDDHGDYGGRATTAKWLREDLDPSFVVPVQAARDPHEKGSKSSSKPKYPSFVFPVEVLREKSSLLRELAKHEDMLRRKSVYRRQEDMWRRKSVNRRLIPFLDTDSNEEGSKSNSKPKLGGPEGEDLQVEKCPTFVFPDPHKEGSKSSSKPKYPSFVFPVQAALDPHKEGSKSNSKPKYPTFVLRGKKGFCPLGVKRDEALWERYEKQIEESEGYDITEWPGVTQVTPIMPIPGFKQCSSYAKAISQFTDAAIKKFNSTGKEEDDQYEVHDIVTVNESSGGVAGVTTTI